MSGSESAYSSPEEAVAAAESSSDFESEFEESADSEDERQRERQAKAAVYQAHREEVAKLRNLRKGSRVVEESDSSSGSDGSTNSDDDSFPARQVLSRAQKPPLPTSQRAPSTTGALARLNAPSSSPSSSSPHSAQGSGSNVGPETGVEHASTEPPVSVQAPGRSTLHAATCGGLVDFWASVALIAALQRTCHLPKLSLARLEHALVDSQKHNVLWRIIAQRLVKPFTKNARSWSDKTWFRSLGRIMANDEHDWLFQGIEEQFNVQLDAPSFDWHRSSLLLRLHILRALLEAQLLVNPAVQRQLTALLALQAAQGDHDDAVEAALKLAGPKGTEAASSGAGGGEGGSRQAAQQAAVKGNKRVAAALQALDKAQQEHEAAFAPEAPRDMDEGWGCYGLEWPIPPKSRRRPQLPLGAWDRAQLQAADGALLCDGAGWRYVLLSDSTGGCRLGRWRHRMCRGELSPLREAQMDALAQAYQTAHVAAADAAAGVIVDDDSSGEGGSSDGEGGSNGGKGGGIAAFFSKKPVTAAAKSSAQDSLPLRPSMLLEGGSDSEAGDAPAPPALPRLPAAFVPKEADVAASIEASRASVVRLGLLRSAVACGVAESDRLPELGGGGGGSTATAYSESEVEGILGQMHVQFRPQLPAWLQAELAGEVPVSLYGLGTAEAELLCCSLQQLRGLAAQLAPPSSGAVFDAEDSGSDGGSEGSAHASEAGAGAGAVQAVLASLLHLSAEERVQLGTALRAELEDIREYEEEQAEEHARVERIARRLALLQPPGSRRTRPAAPRYRGSSSGSSSSSSGEESSGEESAHDDGDAADGVQGGLQYDSPSPSSDGGSSSEGSDAGGDRRRARPLRQRQARGTKRSLDINSLAAFAYTQAGAPSRNKKRATRGVVSYTPQAQFGELDAALDSE